MQNAHFCNLTGAEGDEHVAYLCWQIQTALSAASDGPSVKVKISELQGPRAKTYSH